LRARGDVQAELGALVERYGLLERAADRLAALLALIAADPHAPTTVRDPSAIVADHLADSLVALDLPEVRAARAVLDLGSGAGFPGLPLAIAVPHARVALLETSGRKCLFITKAIEALTLPNAVAIHARAESWSDGFETCDLVAARAVGSLALVAEYAAPMLRIGGSVVAWRGRRDLQEEAAAEIAAGELGLEPREPLKVQPYPAARDRHLHVMMKVKTTPPRFPRRPGVAQKRPLGVRSASDRPRR
jgi:16S rRNA (guanine527-N7)-methyltransferase